MKSDGFGRRVIILFLAVAVGYAVVYHFIQRERISDGPWTVAFSGGREPAISLSQTNLALHDVRIAFTNVPPATNVAETIEFGVPRGVPFEVPFGECVFFDARFLPGTVVLRMFGHEVQFLPRVLTIDGLERPWKSGETIMLGPGTLTNTPAIPTKQY